VGAIGAMLKVQCEEGDERPRVHYVRLELGGWGAGRYIRIWAKTIEGDKPPRLASVSNSNKMDNSSQIQCTWRAGSETAMRRSSGCMGSGLGP